MQSDGAIAKLTRAILPRCSFHLAKILFFFKPTKFSSCFFRLPKNIVRAKIPAGLLCLQPHQAPKGDID